MNQFTQKWAVVSFLEDMTEGMMFHFNETPQHVTLAGVFAAKVSGTVISKGLSDITANQAPFTVIGLEKKLFGVNNDVTVMTIADSHELSELYASIHTYLGTLPAIFNSPEHEADGYIPHSTFQKSGRLKAGETRVVTSLSLIDLFPNNDGYQRKIYKTIHFKSV